MELFVNCFFYYFCKEIIKYIIPDSMKPDNFAQKKAYYSIRFLTGLQGFEP